MDAPRIAVVGAGISGLACAHTLTEHGLPVAVFDKARGAGGRTSTRRSVDVAFDHGAQYFTVRDPRFAARVSAWQKAGIVRPWEGRIIDLQHGDVAPRSDTTQRWVGVPGMSTLTRHLATNDAVQAGVHVERIAGEGGRLTIVSRLGRPQGGFDAVLLAAPAPQTAALVATIAPALAERARQARFSACWAVMLAFRERLSLPFDGAFVQDSPLSWVARNSSKPGRPAAECWVLHGSPQWSDAHFEADAETVIAELVAAFADAARAALPAPAQTHAHRWAYALPTEPLAEDCLFDDATGIGACGDWCGGPRVEGAFLSGVALAERVLAWAAARRGETA